MNHLAPTPPLVLAHQVEAFEDALARDPETDLGLFLPDQDHPLYPSILAELVRVDLELARARNRPRRLADYRRFPGVFELPEVLRAVAFEEYRLRRQAGEAVSAEEYRTAYRIDTADWPSVGPGSSPVGSDLPMTNAVSLQPVGPDAIGSDPPMTSVVSLQPGSPGPIPVEDEGPRPGPPGVEEEYTARWTTAARTLPAPGTNFAGFRLVEELGRGAFGRVYLAHQGDLAARPVALKVACDIARESQTLAQLQHTNIVPIYSFHRVGEFQAVCMPYFGRTTLAHVFDHLRGKAGLPSSGRELKSTFDRRGLPTRPASGSPSSREALGDRPVPAPEGLPAESPAPGPVDGWTRLEGLSYVEAVLWIGEQLADGLAHAHARGILHRDLKPANVLLTDDGRPMLLDFNLAEDTKARGTAERASVGGTLPYMAPEHMEAFRGSGVPLDGRCDVYALGVILFELLTGRHPFAAYDRKKAREAIPAMIADRRAGPPRLRDLNPAVSPATEAIVRKCLAPDPGHRYLRAEHLREDLDRQLNGLPLRHAANPSVRERVRKWAGRHPRVTSSGTVAAAAAVLLLAVGTGAVYARERTRDLQALAQLAEHRAAFDDAQLFLDDRNQSRPHLDVSLAKLRGVLGRYGVPEDGTGDESLAAAAARRLPAADRDRLEGDVGETFYLMAELGYLQALAAEAESAERGAYLDQAERWHAAAEKHAGDRIPRALRNQREGLGDLRAGRAGREKADDADLPGAESPRDLYLIGARLTQTGEHRRALPFLQKSTQLDPENFSAWFVRGTTHLALSQPELAAACFTACIAIRPDFAPAWLNRGIAFGGLKFFDLAAADFDRAIELDPTSAEAYIQRAVVRDATRDPRGAAEDFGRALATGAAPVRVYFLRADVRARLGDAAGAEADREAGLRLTPADELSWVGRAETRLAKNPAGALADVEEALKINPFSVFALQLKAHILAEPLNRPADALAVLARAVRFHPDHAPALAGRGVLLARVGKRDEALRDARDALRRDGRAPNLYQVGCVYALTAKTHPEDRGEAVRLLWAALKTGFGMDMVDTDTDLDPIRTDRAFREMLADARALQAARKP
ncbi:MAG: prkC 12 [Gemmataceae bacterium]|nr:prkC 12 [Gemmataceae bacterium]